MIIFETLIFNCIPFLGLLSRECFILNKNYAIQNYSVTIDVIGRPQRRTLFSALLVWSCFWPSRVCSSFFGVVSCFASETSQNILTNMGQLLQSSTVQNANERNGKGQKILAVDIFSPYISGS